MGDYRSYFSFRGVGTSGRVGTLHGHHFGKPNTFNFTFPLSVAPPAQERAVGLNVVEVVASSKVSKAKISGRAVDDEEPRRCERPGSRRPDKPPDTVGPLAVGFGRLWSLDELMLRFGDHRQLLRHMLGDSETNFKVQLGVD